MKLNMLLATTALTFVGTVTAQAAVLAPSGYFFNKKANVKAAQLEGASTSTVKWMVSTPSKYQVFVTIPANATATAVTYRVYPNGSASNDNSCTTAQRAKPCFEITVDQAANQGKEVQLTASQNLWAFTNKGYVTVSADSANAGEMVGIGNVRFSEVAVNASFSKVANDGSSLPVEAALGTAATDWACTKDNNTGLVWEAKPSDTSLTSRAYTYSWYNANPKMNGGFAGYKNLGACPSGISCDTNGYIKAVNAAKLCGYSNWRLPTVKEYMNIIDPSFIDYTIYSGALDPTYFPGTGTFDRYWTSETTDENVTQAYFVILAGTYGFAPKIDGKDLFRARLVRGK